LIHLGKNGGRWNGGRGFRDGSGCEKQEASEEAAEHETPPAYHVASRGSAAQCRAIRMLRQPALPAASAERSVTEWFPTRSGITADQAMVPVATPAVPKLVAQETRVTPVLSLAVPAMVTEAAVVDSVPVEGVVMVNAGAVVSEPPPPVIGDCRVMATDFERRLAAVDAVMVMVFAPVISGILTML